MSIAQMIPSDFDALRQFMTVEEAEWLLQTMRRADELAATQAQQEAEQRAREHTLAERDKYENSLAEFFHQAWAYLEPGHALQWSWHYDLLCEYLTLITRKQLRRLIINVPPRTAKSSLVTKCWPVWAWARQPEVSFMFASYSKDLSTDHSVHRRNLITSNWYQMLWRDRFQLSSDRNLTTQFSNDKMGTMIATSTGSGAEGKGCDIAVLDDPMSSEQALSDAERLAANRWISNTLKQRLNDPATSAIVIIMQRLHELDTVGFVESEDPGSWTKIELPLVAEHDERWVFPISERVIERKRGEVLQPERFTAHVVEEKRRSRLVFAGQYQQHPAPLEGNLIKRSDVRYYGGKDPVTGQIDAQLPDTFDLVLVSADCAFKDTKTSDFVAVGTIGLKGSRRYWLNVVNDHLDVDGTELEIVRQVRAQQALGRAVSAVLVEDKANGPAVISHVKKAISGVIAVEPEGGKIARFFAMAPEWQAGDHYVDRTAAWAEPFVSQLITFPMAAHDDQCDMASQASIWLQKQARAYGFLEYLKSGQAKNDLEEQQKQDTLKAKSSGTGTGSNGHAADHATPCPKCQAACVAKIGSNLMRCQQCGHQFGEAKTFKPWSRADYEREQQMRR
jgi:predicted phage terminase large subunit-like protein